MTQADRVLSTPPTNTPAVSSRRGFLAQAAVVAAGGAALGMVLPLPVSAGASERVPDTAKAGPVLKDAITALDDAHRVMEAARTEYDAAEAKVMKWDAEHPAPTGKRAKRRYWRKWNDFRNEIVMDKWYALLEAEKNFKKAQGAVATIQAADVNELTLMAAAAAIYDKARLTYGPQAIISYQVALSYFRLHGMA